MRVTEAHIASHAAVQPPTGASNQHATEEHGIHLLGPR